MSHAFFAWENIRISRLFLLHALYVSAIPVLCAASRNSAVFDTLEVVPMMSTESENVQTIFWADALRKDSSAWRLSVSDKWDVLGPFPLHAREQQFLSPSYPLNLSEPIDYHAQWSSAYADNGHVAWTKAQASDGRLTVSFPAVRWASLRATEGWAALQHHTVLHTSITILPPSPMRKDVPPLPHLLIDVQQGSFFTVQPSLRDVQGKRDHSPRWYAGNIYSMHAAPAQAVDLLTPPSIQHPTTYDLFVSGDYEIRLFGDPTVRNSEVPELLVDYSIAIEDVRSKLGLEPSHNVVPDFVSGWAFGEAIGIGLRSVDNWWTVQEVSLANDEESISVKLLQETRLAPTQTRIIPIVLSQKSAFHGTQLDVQLLAVSKSDTTRMHVTLPIKQLIPWNEDHFDLIISSYFYMMSTPTAFVTLPPKLSNAEVAQPPLLTLHGAGVDVLGHVVWDCAPPRQTRSWVIAPTGRTAWGLDWHGPSTQDAWASVEALSHILQERALWNPWRFPEDTRVILVGHSNGGQGTWFVAARYPDRVVAAVPAAAYVKSQAYVPLVQSRSAHFIDPALRAILETSLTADDNDLFLTNLVDTPILAVHGGDDENVPVWHTRALVDTLKTWRPDANITFQEDPKQPHCYPTVFDNDRVQRFIDRTVAETRDVMRQPSQFTLTVSVPAESGTLHGWHIASLGVPGRLARLTVQVRGSSIFVSTRNVKAFSIASDALHLLEETGPIQLKIDGQPVQIETSNAAVEDAIWLSKQEWGAEWKLLDGPALPQVSGRMSLILNSRGPLLFVIPSIYNPNYLNIALRLAHTLNVYHKLDSAIMDAHEALQHLEDGSLSDQNIVTIGGSNNIFSARILSQSRTQFLLRNDVLNLKGRPLSRHIAALFLHPHPHPTSRAALMMFIYASDDASLERACRLFPIRTGVTVPDWIVLSPDTDSMGAGGALGAGVWGAEWDWNEGMSSF